MCLHTSFLWIKYGMQEPRSAWTEDRKKEYHREYIRARKAKFKEQGICPNCEKNPAAEGRVCCPQCLEDKKLNLKFGTAGPFRQLYAELFEKQRGLCGICQKPMGRPLLDHDHQTMEVRGLLCARCNVGLGQFNHDASVLKAALYYLEHNAGIGITLRKR